MAQEPEPFDIWTKGPSSPSKLKKRFKGFVDPVAVQMTGKYEEEDLGFDEEYEAKMLQSQKE